MAYIDPVQSSPNNYKSLLDEGGVRVLKMTVPPGTSDIEHSHPSETVYFVKGGKVRIHVEGGDPMELEIPDGHTMNHGPWTHRVENIGETEIQAIIFERK
ncbi:MAG: cupin domain-containing protein [Planctomycetota bacterium]|nr:cupin domain-containing protein [Planctomycetota bacterium]